MWCSGTVQYSTSHASRTAPRRAEYTTSFSLPMSHDTVEVQRHMPEHEGTPDDRCLLDLHHMSDTGRRGHTGVRTHLRLAQGAEREHDAAEQSGGHNQGEDIGGPALVPVTREPRASSTCAYGT